jgi:hypothetical protein
MTENMTMIKYLSIFIVIIFCFQSIAPVYAQSSPFLLQSSLGTFQADWYGLEVTEINQSLQILLQHIVPDDDFGMLIYDSNIQTSYDPEVAFQPVASGRNFFFSNQIFADFAGVPPGYYTIAIIAYGIVSGEEATYDIVSNLFLDSLGSTHFIEVNIEGLERSYQTNVEWEFLGNTFSEEALDNWYMWVDEASQLVVDQTVPIDSAERFHATESLRWTIVEYDELDIYYLRQYYSSIRTFGLDNNLPIDFSFTSGGKIVDADFSNSWADWVDEGRSLVLPRIIDVNPNERYITESDVIVAVNQPVEHLVEYTRQWRTSVSHNANQEISISSSFLDNTRIHITDEEILIWVDDNSQLTVPAIISSNPLHRWSADSNSWLINSPSDIEIKYREQIKPTIITTGLNQEHPTRINYVYEGVTHTTLSYSDWSDWIDIGTNISFDQEILGTPGEKWITSDNVPNIITEPIVSNINYARQIRISMTFTDAKNLLLDNIPSSVEITSPDGDILSVTDFSNVWVSEGIFKLNNIKYQGADFNPISSLNFEAEPGKSWIIPIGLYDLSFHAQNGLGFSVPNVDVLLTLPNDRVISKQTDYSGHVSFEMIPQGKYVIEITAFGGFSEIYSGDVANDSNSIQDIVINSTGYGLVLLPIFVLFLIVFSYFRSPGLRKTTKKTYKNIGKSFR